MRDKCTNTYFPSGAEIAAACGQIRRLWSSPERRRRRFAGSCAWKLLLYPQPVPVVALSGNRTYRG